MIYGIGNRRPNGDMSIDITYRYAHLFQKQTQMAEQLILKAMEKSNGENRTVKEDGETKIAAFRVSPEEAEQIDVCVRLSGLSKQDYITKTIN